MGVEGQHHRDGPACRVALLQNTYTKVGGIIRSGNPAQEVDLGLAGYIAQVLPLPSVISSPASLQSSTNTNSSIPNFNFNFWYVLLLMMVVVQGLWRRRRLLVAISSGSLSPASDPDPTTPVTQERVHGATVGCHRALANMTEI